MTPGIYTSKSVCFAYDWSSVAKTYPLWVAQYPNYEETGFTSEPWTDGWDFGAWSSPLIFQYTGTGRIAGYGGHLDLDLFYGTKDDWRRLCAVAGGSAGTGEAKEVAISKANVAAQIMEHLCTCPLHGYSQPGRHGTSGHCNVQIDAGTVRVTEGDRDCSSAVCEAWELALAGTTCDGLITRYNWTGGMREMFVGSGLFSWKPMSFNASRGDIYLDEENGHVHPQRRDGRPPGRVLHQRDRRHRRRGRPDRARELIHDYYSGHWDGILRYNGKADTESAHTDLRALRRCA